MNETERDDVRLSIGQILLSPIYAFWKSVTSGPDIENDIELDQNSKNKQEAVLAKSSAEIDKKFENYGSTLGIGEKLEEKTGRNSNGKIVEKVEVKPLSKVPKIKDNIISKDEKEEKTR